jgi:hypothetical protein
MTGNMKEERFTKSFYSSEESRWAKTGSLFEMLLPTLAYRTKLSPV